MVMKAYNGKVPGKGYRAEDVQDWGLAVLDKLPVGWYVMVDELLDKLEDEGMKCSGGSLVSRVRKSYSFEMGYVEGDRSCSVVARIREAADTGRSTVGGGGGGGRSREGRVNEPVSVGDGDGSGLTWTVRPERPSVTRKRQEVASSPVGTYTVMPSRYKVNGKNKGLEDMPPMKVGEVIRLMAVARAMDVKDGCVRSRIESSDNYECVWNEAGNRFVRRVG